MNPIEVDALSKLSPTGQLTTNPDTGQPEAFLPLLGSMLAPTLLGSTAIGAALSPLAASAIGTGLGTIAEGGSLKEGITAGLMGGLTGGLLGKMMPAGATEIAGTEAVTEALPAGVAGPAQTIPAQAAQTIPAATPSTISDLQTAVGSADKGFFGRLTDNLGFTGGATPEQIAADPTMLSSSQAMMGQALPAAASGLVGEMYVPYDMEMPEDDDPYPYEGPYMPTEQRTMMSGFDPMSSAFMGEQDMIGGNVLPDAPNFNMGGLIRMANGGSPAQKQIQESAETLERRKLDQELRDQLARTMSAPMIDPRIGRMADPISTPVEPMPLPKDMSVEAVPLPMPNEALTRERTPMAQKTLNEVMTPQSFQAPSLEEIQRLQTQTLDDLYGPNPDSFLEQEFPTYAKSKEINRKYNPILRGIEHGLPLLTKGGMEVYEAIDEFRNRDK
jgi:hypothetical protein